MGGADLEGGRSGLSSGQKGSLVMEVESYLNYYLGWGTDLEMMVDEVQNQ